MFIICYHIVTFKGGGGQTHLSASTLLEFLYLTHPPLTSLTSCYYQQWIMKDLQTYSLTIAIPRGAFAPKDIPKILAGNRYKTKTHLIS